MQEVQSSITARVVLKAQSLSQAEVSSTVCACPHCQRVTDASVLRYQHAVENDDVQVALTASE